jgi:hypothetical protein
MEAGFRMPAGRQQRKLAAEQGEGARIASRADDSRHFAMQRGAMDFRLVFEESLAVEACAFHYGNAALQQVFRNPQNRIERNADERGIHFIELADMGHGRRFQPGSRRTLRATHHPCQHGGRVGKDRLGAFAPQVSQTDDGKPCFFHVVTLTSGRAGFQDASRFSY